MDPNEMTPTQYFVQKILNKQPIEPMDEVPLGPSLSDLLNTALGQRGISVAAAAELSGINRTSLYKIMDGTVQPQRNTLLRLALTLDMDFEQCQQLLNRERCPADQLPPARPHHYDRASESGAAGRNLQNAGRTGLCRPLRKVLTGCRRVSALRLFYCSSDVKYFSMYWMYSPCFSSCSTA